MKKYFFNRLVYEDQFPVLETIRISKSHLVQDISTEAMDKLSVGEYFETSVSFLYKSFLRKGNSRGESVKRLDVPFPPEEKFRQVTGESCEWRDSSEFWDRAVEMFPNLVKYAAIGGSWKKARPAEVNAWVVLGEKLGFVRKIKQGAGKDPDLNLGDDIYLEVSESVKFNRN